MIPEKVFPYFKIRKTYNAGRNYLGERNYTDSSSAPQKILSNSDAAIDRFVI